MNVSDSAAGNRTAGWGPYPPVVPGGARRRTALAVTLGPASESPSCVRRMVAEGVDVVRLALNSGDHAWHRRVVGAVREAADAGGRPVRLLADLQDRKNRLGGLPDGTAEWQPGQTVELTARRGEFTSHRTWLSHGWAAGRAVKGTRVLIDDGLLELCVEQADADVLRCTVVAGGRVGTGRGVAVQGAGARPADLTDKDVNDLLFVRELGVDAVALSFAAGPETAARIRDLAPGVEVIGKIEHDEGVERMQELAAAFDGLMVARGDLAVELPYTEVPFLQKAVVGACAGHGKVSMVATQLLHSMRDSALPSRAEVADITQAVLDGADCLVLTGETGYGRHPVAAVRTLREVVERAERHLAEQPRGAR
ncbi:pyruvate kinase [Streptomyces sp. SL13]|uniref:Pyruvate kinase n=1 Tax=Streptantibioticus silvisoli TaxID=2705255 RepID=A0AA90H4U2_9ACTN|nr:pyruvate kinase [Streptantibioticus silvisoli]MDI5961184.1 pyruvate kinase [Streptantibioticus silvisoli]MDI5970988.1 pyruvate kinase [Streptantibioticus silvisoli]